MSFKIIVIPLVDELKELKECDYEKYVNEFPKEKLNYLLSVVTELELYKLAVKVKNRIDETDINNT